MSAKGQKRTFVTNMPGNRVGLFRKRNFRTISSATRPATALFASAMMGIAILGLAGFRATQRRFGAL